MSTDDTRLAARLQALEDREAIRDLLVRYARAVDAGDVARLASCFTDDAEATFGGVAAGVGGAAIAAFLMSTMGPGAKPVTTHRVANVAIVLDGDEAHVDSSAIVYGVRGEPEQLRLRGASYHDHCVRRGDEWKIHRRTHSVAWEGAAESVPLTPIDPRR